MCTLQEYLDKNIKKTWLTEIKEDYTSNFLLGEDSLKCSFYFHLILFHARERFPASLKTSSSSDGMFTRRLKPLPGTSNRDLRLYMTPT
ncbi:hypothetical protein SAMN02745219_02340 [Desulfofundulus thermosubterraneus DSM 16057]|uniref:Uncharacterized protein n=1 Tax=Desulfofundulus thermosubterraneus DSM 16057 TaxID=1121432 RepID=A0A1M6IIP7_9FIRM|nr:hypothetical protein SAMN02745219_02340 [Desulfofundulus thermosubterraneus DSM 16057]